LLLLIATVAKYLGEFVRELPLTVVISYAEEELVGQPMRIIVPTSFAETPDVLVQHDSRRASQSTFTVEGQRKVRVVSTFMHAMIF